MQEMTSFVCVKHARSAIEYYRDYISCTVTHSHLQQNCTLKKCWHSSRVKQMKKLYQ